ncbi:MAG: GNAT family N-acetyltransferase [Candidatus Heimdallarchaeota archaeon]|nr:MAG: GNAT family N-acetyltransferase [Candidatus Heimdallarchaeota archaeon]
MVEITKASEKDLESVYSLLKLVDLPIDGVADNFHNFFVAWERNQLQGCAGVEVYEDVGLIRSVAVHPSFQSHGLGRKLVETIQKFSTEKGLKEIYLLTETAEKFFLKLNYIVIPRNEVNSRVKQSSEFTTVCPESAICMVKTLKGDE